MTRYQLQLTNIKRLTNDNQEVRVAFQWRNSESDFNRRVIFYGKISTQKFLEIRLDNTYDPNKTDRKEFLNDNGFAASLPKFDSSLFEELTEVGYQEFLLSQWGNENSISPESFILTFYTYSDEPFGKSEIFINWGVFPDAQNSDIGYVFGQARPYTYYNVLSYSDHFDREFIFLSLLASAIASIFGPLAWPIQTLIYSVVESYTLIIASIQIGNVLAEQPNIKQVYQYSLSNYFLECVLRFNLPIQLLKDSSIFIPTTLILSFIYGIVVPIYSYTSADTTIFFFGFIVPILLDIFVNAPALILYYPANIIFHIGLVGGGFFYMLY